ncbi:hypothetical protein FBU30_002755, partial [Linnemannia zychae]
KEAVTETKTKEEKLATKINIAHNTAKGKTSAKAKTVATRCDEEKRIAEIEISLCAVKDNILKSKNVEVKAVKDKVVEDKVVDDRATVNSNREAYLGSETGNDRPIDDSIVEVETTPLAIEKIVESKNIEVKDGGEKSVEDKTTDEQEVVDKTTVNSSSEANPDSKMDIDKSTDDSAPVPWIPEIGTVFESLQAFEDMLHPWGHRLGFELKRMQSRVDHDPRGALN